MYVFETKYVSISVHYINKRKRKEKRDNRKYEKCQPLEA